MLTLLNLAYGLSAVSLCDDSIGLIGVLPGTVLFCALRAPPGDLARFGDVHANPATWGLRLCGIAATVAVVWIVGRAARVALQDPESESS